MIFETYTGGSVETNGYIITSGDEVIVVDAPEGIVEHLASIDLKPTRLLLTHQHFDHVEDVAEMQKLGVPVYAYSEYSQGLTLEEGAREWGLPIEITPYKVDHLVKEGSELTFGELVFFVLHVPGHSPDSVCYYQAQKNRLLAGDTLFCGGVGRTDLPGHGDEELLYRGIREKLLSLPPRTEVFPGHGGPTTSGEEKQLNPFLMA